MACPPRERKGYAKDALDTRDGVEHRYLHLPRSALRASLVGQLDYELIIDAVWMHGEVDGDLEQEAAARRQVRIRGRLAYMLEPVERGGKIVAAARRCAEEWGEG
jgi:hypothetical protein